VQNANTRGAIGLCLEPHDLIVSKYVAGREKDHVFIRAAARHRLVRKEVLLERLEATEVDAAAKGRIRAAIGSDFRQAETA